MRFLRGDNPPFLRPILRLGDPRATGPGSTKREASLIRWSRLCPPLGPSALAPTSPHAHLSRDGRWASAGAARWVFPLEKLWPYFHTEARLSPNFHHRVCNPTPALVSSDIILSVLGPLPLGHSVGTAGVPVPVPARPHPPGAFVPINIDQSLAPPDLALGPSPNAPRFHFYTFLRLGVRLC